MKPVVGDRGNAGFSSSTRTRDQLRSGWLLRRKCSEGCVVYGQEGFKLARGGASAAAVNAGFRVLRAIGEWRVRPDFKAKGQGKEGSLTY